MHPKAKKRGSAPSQSAQIAEPDPRQTAGLILIDKPEGPTSHDVVNWIRRKLAIGRCGHAGTLDPFASGLIVIAIGRATRLLRFLSRFEKTYEGAIRLGYATDTDDRTGKPLAAPRPTGYTEMELRRAIGALSGEIQQTVPAYSARKHLGVAFHRLARKGNPVPTRSAAVTVRWDAWERGGPGLLRVRVTVSAGTYVRALARDLGEALGCGGHLVALRRVSSGPFRIEDALPMRSEGNALLRGLIPPESIPLGLPTVSLDPAALARIRSGGAVTVTGQIVRELRGWVRLLDGTGGLVGVAEASLRDPCAAEVPEEARPSSEPLAGERGPDLVLDPRIVF